MLQHIDVLALGGNGAHRAARFGQVYRVGPRLAAISRAAEDGVIDVIFRERSFHFKGTPLEDDVDDIAIQGHLRVIVKAAIMLDVEMTPRGVVFHYWRNVLRGDGLATVGRSG